MRRQFFKFILWALGWKIDGWPPQDTKKYVLIVAPHTSNWDFFLGVAARSVTYIKSGYLVKAELFKYVPVAWFLRVTGGIPVQRNHPKNNIVQQVVQRFDEAEEMVVTITPEGTRKKVGPWKTGFYRIAAGAKIPILLVAFDFGTKTVRFLEEFHPTGDMHKDVDYIRSRFVGIKGKRPELGVS